jgi:hypothetical protein
MEFTKTFGVWYLGYNGMGGEYLDIWYQAGVVFDAIVDTIIDIRGLTYIWTNRVGRFLFFKENLWSQFQMIFLFERTPSFQFKDFFWIWSNLWPGFALGSSHFNTPSFRFLKEILRWVSFLTGSGFTYLRTTQNCFRFLVTSTIPPIKRDRLCQLMSNPNFLENFAYLRLDPKVITTCLMPPPPHPQIIIQKCHCYYSKP